MVSSLICDTIKVEQHTDRKEKIMKTNVTKRIVTLVLAFAVVFTAVFAGGTSVEAAENVQTLYISSDVPLPAAPDAHRCILFSRSPNFPVQIVKP